MLTELTISNFKCYGSEVNAPLAPITLLYGENSAGKSTLLQALLLFERAFMKCVGGSAELRHGNLASNPAQLFYQNTSSNPIRIGVSSFEGVRTRQHAVGYTSSDNTLKVFRNITGSWFWPEDSGNSKPWNQNRTLVFNFTLFPLIRDVYEELHSRRGDVVEGYRRCAEMMRMDRYVDSHDEINKQVFAVVKKYDSSRQRNSEDESFEGDFTENDVPKAERFTAGLPEWFHFAAPEWSNVRNVQEDMNVEWITEAIDFYSREFSYEEFCARHHNATLVVASYFSGLKEIAGRLPTLWSADWFALPLMVQDIVMASDPRIFLAYSWSEPPGEPLQQKGEYYPRTSSHVWKNKSLAKTLGVGDSHEMKSSGRHILFKMLCTECDRISQSVDINWIGPVRAIPLQKYSLDKDKKGYSSADASFLMDPKTRRQVNLWLERFKVGYEVDQEVTPSEGGYVKHVVLRDIYQKDDVYVNWAEAGFGIGQVLPIIAHCISPGGSLIAIQQPELHIHPRLQAELGDLFLEAVKKQGHQLIVETHSEHLMLRIQKLIRKGELAPEDVSVLYVSRGEDGSTVKRLALNEQGEFMDEWPDGFFPERIKELLD